MAEPAEPEVEDAPLTEAELASSPLVEAGGGEVVVPKKGKLFAEDGSMKVAIIRPCVSRGKRIKGLPPIYEAQMLARSASVFKDWPMYMDHLYEAEALIEALKKAHRPITDLGGRVLETWFDPEFKMPHDDDRGYRPGSIVGRVIPQPAPRAMLEADPGILNVSINAFPTGARPGTASWNPALKGMMIEGISPVPRGSVDWVFRGGAGGHPIAEADLALAVSILEGLYDPAQHEEHTVSDFAKMTLEELRESLGKENPALLAEITKPPSTTSVAIPAGITEDKLTEALDAQKTALTTAFEEKLTERDTAVETEVERRLSERDELRGLERHAHQLIESSTLPPSWKTDLKGAYTLLPSGPTAGLLVEEKTDDKGATVGKKDVLKERVEEDVTHALLRLQEAQGKKPRVTGLGGTSVKEGEEDVVEQSEDSMYLEERFSEMGILSKDDKGKIKFDGLLEALEA